MIISNNFQLKGIVTRELAYDDSSTNDEYCYSMLIELEMGEKFGKPIELPLWFTKEKYEKEKDRLKDSLGCTVVAGGFIDGDNNYSAYCIVDQIENCSKNVVEE